MSQREFDFDFLVVGGGSGGVRAARMAAQAGARVAIVEATKLGGTCVNVGCIPKKLYSYAATYAEHFEEAAGFGWTLAAKPQFDWETLKRNRNDEILRLNEVYRNLLSNAGVEIMNGWASFVDAHTVDVSGQRISARNILIATGGRPTIPDIPGKDLGITSDEMFDLPAFPRRLLVVGGGYIGCEFASIFNALGAHVLQVHRHPRLISAFDTDLSDFLEKEMRKTGVEIELGRTVERLTRRGDAILATLDNGQTFEAGVVLFATGRAPAVRGLGLETIGMRADDRGAVSVDDNYGSSVPSIHAVGDVSSRQHLTPIALAEAMVVVGHLFGDGQRRMDYANVPTAIFTHPNVGTVGLSEAQARAKFDEIDIYRSEFRALKHTLSGSPARTMMKLVVDRATDKVLGVHMVGEEAGEIIQGFAVALRAGATKRLFDTTIGIHPTAAEEFVNMRQPVAD
ncbi:glutathione-disulfide reductase [Caballeronia sp. LZ035]|uniref:glutathione-disulfide reductase n=1 Tax=Caballeronia sp. LZ035 TaxID=3038568 RepID=UPI0028560C47|nr:glutathione-disulfide reductase [Caballeronia sp. LZ035]MDR5758985.1 glutathione-disulfide reductase [Caballeronia sp. LZ035]